MELQQCSFFLGWSYYCGGRPGGVVLRFFVDVDAASLEVCKNLLGLLSLLLVATPPPSELEVHPPKLVIHSLSKVDC